LERDFFLQDACNPTIVKLPNKDLYLVSWRSFDDYDLKFGILNMSTLNRTLSNSTLEDGFGFSPSHRFPIPVQQFNYDQQDPRLLAENSTSLLLSYTVFLGNRPNGKFKQSFARLGVNGSKNVTIGQSHLLDYPQDGPNQKNWVPFFYDKKVLFMQSIVPLHVVEVVNDEGGNAVVKTFVRGNETDVPWKGWHGWPIRGGTPAILVRGVYLSFLHVLFMFQFPYKLRTYFMGAVTFCPTPPFAYHSMSSHPIVKDTLYQGPWVNIKVDYVVFPTGLSIDPDDVHLWLTFGWQDKHGWLVKMNIDELFASLTLIKEC